MCTLESFYGPFHTIPERGEVGYESWQTGIEITGNAGVWAAISGDPELGHVYLPTEAATSDAYGGERHGDNLFSSSVVTVDVKTGERIWHYQLVHHDIWDYDIPSPPIVADLPNGRKVVMSVTKQSWVYTFDRLTGEPIWPIVERPVPAGDVPGEWYSSTQPFPTRPAPFDRQGFTEDDLIDFTPELRALALEATKDYRLSPTVFTPPSLAAAADGTRGTLSLPNATGGSIGRVQHMIRRLEFFMCLHEHNWGSCHWQNMMVQILTSVRVLGFEFLVCRAGAR